MYTLCAGVSERVLYASVVCSLLCLLCAFAYIVNIFLFGDSYLFTPSSRGHDDTNDADIKSLKHNKAMPQLVNLVV